MPRTLHQEWVAANERQITGPHPALANEVRKLLGYDSPNGSHFLTGRMACVKCGVNAASITDATNGYPLRMETLYDISIGLGGDVDALLRAGGLSRYARPPHRQVGVGTGDDPEETELLNLFTDLDPEKRRLLLAIARTINAVRPNTPLNIKDKKDTKRPEQPGGDQENGLHA